MKIFNPEDITRLIYVDDTDIVINADHMAFGLRLEHREFIEDIIARYHHDRQIWVLARDGANLSSVGFFLFLQNLCDVFSLDPKQITVVSYDDPESHPWNHETPFYSIVNRASDYIKDIPPNRPDAKMFGLSVARFSPARLRILYEIDRCFTGDTFMICNFDRSVVNRFKSELSHTVYSDELNWFWAKIFDLDPGIDSRARNANTVAWQTSYVNYSNIANQFHIEIVIETFLDSPRWFTEKIGKCLISGKPFLLMSGPGALGHLRDLGFKTFGSVIDEKYDQAPTMPQRLQMMIETMHYIRTNRDEILPALNAIAVHNAQHLSNNTHFPAIR